MSVQYQEFKVVKMKKSKLILSSLAIAVVSACTNISDSNTNINNAIAERDSLTEAKSFIVSNMPYSKKTPVRSDDVGDKWLQSKIFRLSKDISGVGVPMSEIIKAFGSLDINIVSTVPIENNYYYGPPIVSGTTADSALQLLTQQMGLDYEVISKYGSTPYIRITEMGTLTYRLRVPDVITSFNMSSPLTLAQVGDKQSSNASSNNQSVNQGQQNSNDHGNAGQTNTNNQAGGVYTSYQTAFWQKLESELQGLMRIIGPDASANEQSSSIDYMTNQNMQQSYSLPHQFQSSAQINSAAQGERTVGRVVVNSLTGNVSVTAPRHIRQRVETYLNDIDDELNTRISVKTRIVSVTRSAEETRGIDIAGFKSFANDKYGVAVTNNVLGEVAIGDLADGVRRVSSSDALTQSLIGVTRADKAFEAFFAYLQSTGVAQSVSNLSGTANSGRTVFLRRAGNDPVLRNSTTTVTTDGGNTLGGSNSSVEENYTGTSMKVTPVYNARRGLVNTMIDIEMVLDAGEKAQTEQILAGTTIKPNTIFLKKMDSINIQTMSVARLGETIVVGNFTTEQQVDNESGVTGLRNSFVGDLFGKKSKRTVRTDYFVLLSVDAHRYGSGE